ncbi:MAG TPA: hypothetical protein VJS45_01395, partial [Acidimicrobiia bacterium]|nr:hypothetical protein [Acidimicrobiia bacterium]
MSGRRLRLLRGYGPVVALAMAFLAVSALTVPARRLQLTVGADPVASAAAGSAVDGAAAGDGPVASGAVGSGSADHGST